MRAILISKNFRSKTGKSFKTVNMEIDALKKYLLKNDKVYSINIIDENRTMNVDQFLRTH